MCGRTAQSRYAVATAASLLGSSPSSSSTHNKSNGADTAVNDKGSMQHGHYTSNDNLNMSPGQAAFVFHKQQQHHPSESNSPPTNTVTCSSKLWGLVPRGGTPSHPLSLNNPTQHYSYKMFNARSDTLYDKVSFRNLALSGNTCVVAVDGFYEWKDTSRTAAGGGMSGGGGKKQPYFVHCKHGSSPMLLAGLWTSVPTGRNDEGGKKIFLDTFTILTTSSCKQLSWLHHRQPVIFWNVQDALQWVHSPSQQLLKKLSNEASLVDHDDLAWHAVTKRMSNSRYSGLDCVEPVALEAIPSVKLFFGGSSSATAPKKEEDGGLIKEPSNKRKLENQGATSIPKMISQPLESTVYLSPSQTKAVRNPYAVVKKDEESKKKRDGYQNHFHDQISNDSCNQHQDQKLKNTNHDIHSPYIHVKEEKEEEIEVVAVIPANKRTRLEGSISSFKSSPLSSSPSASLLQKPSSTSCASKSAPTEPKNKMTTATKRDKKLQTITSFFGPKVKHT